MTSKRLILPSSLQHRKDVADTRPARTLRQRRQYGVHGRAASGCASERTTQVIACLLNSLSYPPPHGLREVLRIPPEIEQRAHILLLRGDRVAPRRAPFVNHVGAERFAHHTYAAAPCNQPHQKMDVFAHAEARGISAKLDEYGTRHAQRVRITKMIGDERLDLLGLIHDDARATRRFGDHHSAGIMLRER